jgi:phosphohistidine phosphatase
LGRTRDPALILYFLRHADAGAVGATRAEDDVRELTASGEAELRGAFETWRRVSVRPAIVISSPLPRAQRSAQLLVEGLGGGIEITCDDRLLPGAQWANVSAVLAEHADARRVLFVGHEPDLSGVIEALTGGRVAMQLGSLACVEFEASPAPNGGRLSWLLDPHLYLAWFNHEH